jgi:lysyl-tRNA synthetase class 2
MSQPNYSNETLDRLKKLDRIRSLGVNPFATRFDQNKKISEINTEYRAKIDIENGDTSPFRTIEDVILEPKSDVAIAGRVMLHRSFGKICFATIADGIDRIQVLFSRDNCSINTETGTQTEL